MSLGVWQATIVSVANGLPIPGAQITVVDATTGLNAVLKLDRNGGGSLTNPFNADAEGFARFYVHSGRYNITAENLEYTAQWKDVTIDSNGRVDMSVQQVAISLGGQLNLSEDGVSVFLVDLDRNITDIILPTNTDPEAAVVVTIVFNQPLSGGFSVNGWPVQMQWEFGLTPVIDDTPYGKTTVQLLLLDGKEPLGVS